MPVQLCRLVGPHLWLRERMRRVTSGHVPGSHRFVLRACLPAPLQSIAKVRVNRVKDVEKKLQLTT